MSDQYFLPAGNGFEYGFSPDPQVFGGRDHALNIHSERYTAKWLTAYRHTVENSVYVAPDSERRGVWRALLDSVLNLCQQADYREVIAINGDSANEASIALHRRAGFVYVGTLRNVGFKFGRWLDSVIMQRSLPEG